MNLYILRHGLAVELGTAGCKSDFDRHLTTKGERKMRDIAAAMRKLQLWFDLVLTSPYVRAHQTAEIVADAFKISKRLELCDALSPGRSSRKLIDAIKGLDSAPGDLLLVGHEPDLSDLISLLVFGQEGCSITLKKGGLCRLTVPTLKYGRCANLEWLLTSRQLRSLGK